MSSNLYLLFEAAGSESKGLPVGWVERLKISGYSFSDTSPLEDVAPPDERPLRVRCLLYARNHFRIYITDMAVQLSQEAPLPPDLAIGEKEFLTAILSLTHVRLRRWVATDEDWDDDDKEVVKILGEGKDQETLKAYLQLLGNTESD